MKSISRICTFWPQKTEIKGEATLTMSIPNIGYSDGHAVLKHNGYSMLPSLPPADYLRTGPRCTIYFFDYQLRIRF